MIHLGAFESTKIHGSGLDVLETTFHKMRWQSDLDLLLKANLTELRYPIPWHRIEYTPGEYDFSWIDGPMEYMRRNKMRPIVDPLHHTSFPDWLEGGFSHRCFPQLYERFIHKLLERYEWIDRYTVVNEPFATTILCSRMGVWYPYQSSEAAFIRMCLQMSRAICLASRAIRHRNTGIELIRTDTCEYHHPMDSSAVGWTDFCNNRRFLIDDLTHGMVDRFHPLWEHCVRNGATQEKLKWFLENRIEMDLFGVDYYAHSEIDWRWNSTIKKAEMSWPVSSPQGFASLAEDYSRRYQKPLILMETNIRGTVTDRISWLKYMEEQCELFVQRGGDLRGFCWFPSIDSTDWNHLCARCTSSVDPQGIWWLDEKRWNRHASELSYWYSRLAAGRATAADLPSYPFLEPLAHDLVGHQKLMNSWSLQGVR